MKVWIVALIEVGMAMLSLVAYFYAENVWLAGATAVVMAAVGVAFPILRARKEAQVQAYVTKQYDRANTEIQTQLNKALADVEEPALPGEAEAGVLFSMTRAEETFGVAFKEMRSVFEHSPVDAAPALLALSQDLAGEQEAPLLALGAYLEGLTALVQGAPEESIAMLQQATEHYPSWTSPWLAWMTALYRLERDEALKDAYPQLHGVELLPFGLLTQEQWISLSEPERERQTSRFQTELQSMGGLYAASEMRKTQAHMQESREVVS